MAPMKATWQTLAILLVICLTIIGRPERAEAQRGDAGTAIKQEYKEKYLHMLQAELLNRRNQLNTAKLDLELILSQEKATGKIVVPAPSLSAALNKDSAIERAQTRIAKLEDALAAFKVIYQDPEKAPAYLKAQTALIAERNALEARMNKLRSEWEKTHRESMAAAREKAKARVEFLAKAEKSLSEEFAKTMKAYADTAAELAAADKGGDLARKLEQAQEEAQRARAQAEQLRAQLELERAKAVQAERDAIAQRDAARLAEGRARQLAERALAEQEAARAAAEFARNEVDKVVRLEKQRADQAVYAAQLQAAQHAYAKEKAHAPGDLEANLAHARAMLQRNFEQKRADLTAQLKQLDQEQHRMLAELEKKAQIMRERMRDAERGPGPSSSDPLDQILEKLQRIEMRLDRLEKARQSRVDPQQPK